MSTPILPVNFDGTAEAGALDGWARCPRTGVREPPPVAGSPCYPFHATEDEWLLYFFGVKSWLATLDLRSHGEPFPLSQLILRNPAVIDDPEPRLVVATPGGGGQWTAEDATPRPPAVPLYAVAARLNIATDIGGNAPPPRGYYFANQWTPLIAFHLTVTDAVGSELNAVAHNWPGTEDVFESIVNVRFTTALSTRVFPISASADLTGTITLTPQELW